MQEIQRRDYKCMCGKLLFKGELSDAHVEIKCRGCGKICQFEGERHEAEEAPGEV